MPRWLRQKWTFATHKCRTRGGAFRIGEVCAATIAELFRQSRGWHQLFGRSGGNLRSGLFEEETQPHWATGQIVRSSSQRFQGFLILKRRTSSRRPGLRAACCRPKPAALLRGSTGWIRFQPIRLGARFQQGGMLPMTRAGNSTANSTDLRTCKWGQSSRIHICLALTTRSAGPLREGRQTNGRSRSAWRSAVDAVPMSSITRPRSRNGSRGVFKNRNPMRFSSVGMWRLLLVPSNGTRDGLMRKRRLLNGPPFFFQASKSGGSSVQ